MDLAEGLINTPERETAGSVSLDRFDFQTCWGVFNLLKLHETENDYAIGFEFHDDIVILDSATTPGCIRFFQVKGKSSGNWTIKALTKQKESRQGKQQSIAGKLFSNADKFGASTDHLGFVSNQPTNFLDSEKPICCLTETSSADFDKFMSALISENANASYHDGALFHFHKTPFTEVGYEHFLKGKIHEFIEGYCAEAPVADCTGFYLSVIDHCRRKSKFLADMASLDDLLKSKFVAKADVADWIDKLVRRVQSRPSWGHMAPQVATWPAIRQRVVKQAWDKYSIDRLQISNTSLSKLRDQIRREIESLQVDNEMGTIDIVETLLPSARIYASKLLLAADENYLRAIILYEFSI